MRRVAVAVLGTGLVLLADAPAHAKGGKTVPRRRRGDGALLRNGLGDGRPAAAAVALPETRNADKGLALALTAIRDSRNRGLEPTSKSTLPLSLLESSISRGIAGPSARTGSNADIPTNFDAAQFKVKVTTAADGLDSQGFAIPMPNMNLRRPTHGPCPPKDGEGCLTFDMLSPLEQKVKMAEEDVAKLAKVRKIEADTLRTRIQREQAITDQAFEMQLSEQEKLSSEMMKLAKVKEDLKEAKKAVEQRKQILVDPNRFTDACSPGFRCYWTGKGAERLSYDDKKIIAKALKDQHCNDEYTLCKCDLSNKANTKSILGKVNAGIDCECWVGLAKQIEDEEKAREKQEELRQKQVLELAQAKATQQDVENALKSATS